jgi:hypothetical protein
LRAGSQDLERRPDWEASVSSGANAHILALLASFEEMLKVTTRSLELAEKLAKAHADGVTPPDLDDQREEIARLHQSVLNLGRTIAEFKSLFTVH